MVNISAMSRDQAKEYLRSLGEEAHPKWTSVEIKSRIKELLERDRLPGLGVNSNSLKSEIQKKCEEKGLTVTKNDTRGSLLRKLRSAQEFEMKGTEDTVVGFGQFANRMYREIPQYYLDWVIEIFRETPLECNPKLARLAAWALAQQEQEEEEPDDKNKANAEQQKPENKSEPDTEKKRTEVKTPVPKTIRSRTAMESMSSASSSVAPLTVALVVTGRSQEKRATKTPEDEESVMTSSTSRLENKMENMMEQMMAKMQTLQTRITDLEQQRPATMDKITVEEPTPSEDSFKLVYP